ncbi:rho GTPase-activating protein 27-like [Gastrophryne carolinensis]
MQTVGSLDKDYVLVEHGFEYASKDGTLISIKPHERYVLLKKTNEHWWQVSRDLRSKPFYIPAKYVKVLSALSQRPAEEYQVEVEAPSEEAPKVEYSYKFLPADPPPKTTPGRGQNATGATGSVQRYSLALGSSSFSLSDISVIRENPATNGGLSQGRGGTLAPLRTFHNSKKFLDPLKRTSFMCPPEEFQPSIRPSQSLNDLHLLKPDQATPDRWRPGDFTVPFVQGDSPPAIQISQTAGVAGKGSLKKEDEEAAVYENVKDIQEREQARSRSSASTIDDWETHTDQNSGQHFYYNCVTGETTWDCPFDQAEEPLQSAITPTSLSPAPEDWEKLFDESSGQFYFYNPLTGETSWDLPAEDSPHPAGIRPMFSPYGTVDKRPPTPEADYPESLVKEIEAYPEADYDGLYMPSPLHNAPSEEQLPGWSCQIRNGQKLYINDRNGETWLQSEDQHGKTYFYTPDGSVSQWSLPQLEPPEFQKGTIEPDHNSNVTANWKPSYATFVMEKGTDLPQIHSKGLEKAGVLHKTKTTENGRRLRKNWSSSWTVLEGGILTFFKDAKNLSSSSLRQSLLTTPEHTVKLQGASLGWASKEKSSKKHVIELKTQDGCEYLIHHDSEAITTDWYTSISRSIGKDARISCDSTSENESEPLKEFGSTEKLGIKDEKEKKAAGQNSNNTDSDRNVRAKLRKFLQRRPTLQSLKDKGYIQDQMFGCPLHELCERERRPVPQFVSKSIQAVEKRGLDIDGLYRVSGNLAIIQKLRYKADHDENLNLEDGKWEDVHVITGALKLFFRELPEPLFPYSHFNDFIDAIKLGDQNQKIRRLRELVLSLPSPNLETMRLLFRHLCSVIEHKESNRMSVQSVAIVFGPTLLKPEEEGSNNIAMFMVFQNQIVEQVLIHYKYIFSS